MILVLDFGSQYTQLIARRIRESRVYCEIHPYNISPEKIRALKPEGIMRHASFQGLREDKRPREVEEEEPVPAPVEKPAKKSAKTKNLRKALNAHHTEPVYVRIASDNRCKPYNRLFTDVHRRIL